MNTVAMDADTHASRSALAAKAVLLLLALVLPGGSLILLGLATWRTMKAAQDRRLADSKLGPADRVVEVPGIAA